MSYPSSTSESLRPIVTFTKMLHPAAVATAPSRVVTRGDVLLKSAMEDLYPANLEQVINPELALKHLNEAAEYRHPVALTLLGKIHEQGKFGVTQNYEQASIFYKKASDLDFGEASYRYGVLCLDGHIPGQDVVVALNYIELATRQNYRQLVPAKRDRDEFGIKGPPRDRFTGAAFV